MRSAANDTDVLIVGAGPVGLFLANECARRGLRYRIVEAHSTQSEHSKALAIFPRTLEIFDMAGIAGHFLDAANRVTSVAVVTHRHTLARMKFAPEESPYPFVAMVPQDVTEKLLADHLRAAGGTVEYDTTFVSAVEQQCGVSVTLDHKGETLRLTATFVVGCDGSHSSVRHLLQLPFDGAQYDGSFMLADIETNEELPADEMQLCPHELGPVAIFPMSSTRRRLVAAVDSVEGEAPTIDAVRKILEQRGPGGLEVRSLRWSTYFRIHHRQVAELRVGRIFVAGDAAHIHSPFGGQGMNTGLHDIWNLVWKLDLVLNAHASDVLLDSYSAERRPVIKNVIETTDKLTRAMGTPSKLAQVLRNALIPMVSRLAPFQHAFVQRLSELGVAYAGSPIVEGPGRRYFVDSLRGGKGIRSRFLLEIDSAEDEPAKEAARRFADSFREIVELRWSSGQRLTLVRPDGYVAYSSRGHPLEAELRAAREVLERQTV